MDDANTYDVTGGSVRRSLGEQLPRIVENEAWFSGRPVDEIWDEVIHIATQARITPLGE